MNEKEIESLKKKSLFNLNLSKDTKSNVTNTDIDKMVREIKLLTSRKNIVVVVLER